MRDEQDFVGLGIVCLHGLEFRGNGTGKCGDNVVNKTPPVKLQNGAG